MNAAEFLLLAFIGYAIIGAIRDGILAWQLIRAVIRGATASPPAAPASTSGPTVDPFPVPVPVVPVAPAPAPTPEPVPTGRKPRNTSIIATSFASASDSVVSRTGAYDGILINGDTELAAAVPYRTAAHRLVRIFFRGKTADVPIRDVGPWNTHDPYPEAGSRPLAETQYAQKTKAQNGEVPTNPAGLDLTPAAWRAVGFVGDARYAKDIVDWDYIDVLEGRTAPPPLQTPSVAATTTGTSTIPDPLVLMRKLRDMGVHASHDSPIILGWPGAIATKFPEMSDYVKTYIHDSTPWCGLAMAYVMAMSGIKPVFGATDTDKFLWADAWRQWGVAVDAPQLGDVLVFQWAGGGHHVTLYDHREEDAYYHCTGGNQGSGHVLSTEALPIANCIAIRRAPAAS